MTKIAEVRDTDCYVFSDNSEAILEALEEKDEFDQDFCVTANKASISSLKCLIWHQKIGPHNRENHISFYSIYHLTFSGKTVLNQGIV